MKLTKPSQKPAKENTSADNLESLLFGEIPQSMQLLQSYGGTLTGVTDDFWEEHILNAKLYEIRLKGETIGHFCLYHEEKLTLFALDEPFRRLGQKIFQQILRDYQVKSAFAATCDELLLSLCLDFHKRLEMQAYFFDGETPHPVRPAEFPRESLREISPAEIDTINGETEGFFDFATKASLEKGEQRIFRLRQDGKTLGYGIIVPVKLRPGLGACGMITLPNQRRRGAGRSILIHLAEICRESGLIPISGCWYQNLLSKATIESAGRYAKTRLINFIF